MDAYLIFKTLHIVSVIAWMAGLLYLFRLFIYHLDYGQKNLEIHQLLSLMAARLYKIITFPAMLIAVAAGAMMVTLNPALLTQPWFLVKLACAFLMLIFTLYGGLLDLRFQKKELEGLTSKKLRILNEVPTLLMIIIVVMVVFRPLLFWVRG